DEQRRRLDLFEVHAHGGRRVSQRDVSFRYGWVTASQPREPRRSRRGSARRSILPPTIISRHYHGEGSPMIELKINGKMYQVDVDPETPLLWVIRDHIGLTGTKYGCGIQQCGAGTVHINGEPTRSCGVPVSAVGKDAITTIE